MKSSPRIVSVSTIAILGCAMSLSASANLWAQQGYPPPPQQQQGYGPPPGQNYGPPQGPGGWDAPPPEFAPVQQQGFRDGVRAARQDARAGRPFAVTHSPYYRHPPTPRDQHDMYRDAFQRGYDRVMRHRGDAPPPPPPGQYYPR